jgi:hypothetical protein
MVVALADGGRLGRLRGLYDFPYGDKAGHLLLYGLLTFLCLNAFSHLAPDRRRAGVGVAAVIAGLAVVEELSQLWLPSRSADAFDLAASVLGVALGLIGARQATTSPAPRRYLSWDGLARYSFGRPSRWLRKRP